MTGGEYKNRNYFEKFPPAYSQGYSPGGIFNPEKSCQF